MFAITLACFAQANLSLAARAKALSCQGFVSGAGGNSELQKKKGGGSKPGLLVRGEEIIRNECKSGWQKIGICDVYGISTNILH